MRTISLKIFTLNFLRRLKGTILKKNFFYYYYPFCKRLYFA